MDSRIRAFDNIFRERLLVRLSGVGPDQDPDEYREMLCWLPPPLLRQDNRHHLLPDDKFAEWFAGNAEEKEAIMAEYEQDELPEDDAERNGDPLEYEDEDEVYDMILLE
jgi:hypothetical protein